MPPAMVSLGELIHRLDISRGGETALPLSPAAPRRRRSAGSSAPSAHEGPDGAGGDAITLWLPCGSAPAGRDRDRRDLLAAGARSAAVPAERRSRPAARGPLALVGLLIRHGALEWQGDRKGRSGACCGEKGDAVDKAAIIELLDRSVSAIAVPRCRGGFSVVTLRLARFSTPSRAFARSLVSPVLSRAVARSISAIPSSYLVHRQQPDADEADARQHVDVAAAMIVRASTRPIWTMLWSW